MANWTNNIVAGGVGATADFSQLTLSGYATVTLDSSPIIGDLIFGDQGNFWTWEVDPGSGGSLTMAAGSKTPAITVLNQSATITAPVAGTNGLVTSGAGTLIFTGTNFYSGGTTVSQGTLELGSATAAGNGLITLGDSNTGTNAVQLTLDSGNITNNIIVSAQGSGTATLYGAAQYQVSLGTITLDRPTTLKTYDANGSDWWYAWSQIGGNVGTLTLQSGATPSASRMILNSPNTFIGTVVMSSGRVQISDGGSTEFGDGNNSLTIDTNADLRLYSGSPSVDALNGGGNIYCDSGANPTLSIGNANGSGMFTGVIGAYGATGLSLIKNGSGTEILSNADVCTGTPGTEVNAGTLEVDGSLGGTETVAGGTLDGSGTITGMLTIQSGGVVGGALTLNASTTVGNGGTLEGGTGGINGPVTVVSGGTLMTGPSGINTLTINSGLFLSGNVSMRINSTAGSSDLLQGMTSLYYGGTLTVTDLGNSLVAGDSFTLFQSPGGYNNSFTNFVLPALPAGLFWDVSQLNVNGSIAVVSVTPTPTFSISGPMGAQSVTISVLAPGATIYYTTDGSTPTTSSSVYSSPIPAPATGSITIKAIAQVPGYGVSAVASQTFTEYAKAVWANPFGGSWPVAQNWSNNVVAGGIGVTADFSQLTLPTNETVTLNSSPTIGNLIFGDKGSNNWEIAPGSGGSLTLSAGTNTPTISVLNQTTTILAPVAAGTNGLLTTGAGTLDLAGANSYSGGTTVSQGTLELSSDTAAGSGVITLGDHNTGTNDVQLTINSGNITNNIVVSTNGSGSATLYATAQYHTTPPSQTITLDRPTTLKTYDANGGDWWYAYGHIGGNVGTLTLQSGATPGASRMVLNSPNTFIGTVVMSSGRVQISDGGSTSFGNGSNSLTVDANAELLIYNGVARVDALNGAGNIFCFNGAYQTLSVGNGNGSGNFSGTIGNNGGYLNLIKNGSGTEILSGFNPYTGTTIINGGTLEVDGQLGLGGQVTVNANAKVDGVGTIENPVVVNDGGTLAAGTNSVLGALYAYNTVALNPGSTTLLRISKNGGIPASDEISGAGGNLAESGTLIVTNITSDGTPLAVNDAFTLFPGFSYSGTFDRYMLPPLPTGLYWDVSQLAVSGSISVASGSAPPIFSPSSTRYVGGLTVTISSLSAGATIYYTTNGATPTTGSPSGVTPVTVTVPPDTTMTIKAFAQASGAPASLVASATYTTESGPAVWVNPNGYSWSTAINWTNNIVPNNSGATADFSQLVLPGSMYVNLDGAWTVGNLIFGDKGSNNTWEIDPGNGGSLALSAGTNTPTISVLNEATTITAPLTGSSGLNKMGAGTLTLSGNNPYGGVTTISQGTLQEAAANSSGSGPIILGSPSTGTNDVQLIADDSIGNPISVSANGSGRATIQFISSDYQVGIAGSTLTLNRPTTLVATNYGGGYGVQTLGINGDVGTLTVEGATNGAGINFNAAALKLNITGTIDLASGNMLFWGPSDSTNPVVVAAGNTNATPTFFLGDGTLWPPVVIGSLNGAGSVQVFEQEGAFRFPQTLSVGNDNGSGTYSGVIADGAYMLSLIKAGTGTETLSGTNTYTGATTVSGGTLEVDGAIVNSTNVIVAGGGTLDGDGMIGSAVTVQSGGTFEPGATTNTAIGSMTITNTLNLMGTTVLTLDRTNAQTASQVTGVTTLSYGGTLTVNNAGPALQQGDSFQLFKATSYVGDFTATNLPALGSGLAWSWTPATGTLSVVPSGGTAPVLSGGSFSNGQFMLTFSGSSGQSYKVLTSTNVALPKADWTVVTSGTFGGAAVTYTNTTPTNKAQFYQIVSP